MKTAAGLVLAVLSAVALNWGFYVQHAASATGPPLQVGHPLRLLQSLLSNLRWLAGWLAGWAGWAAYIAALSLAPLSLVQSLSAGGLGLLAVFAWRFGATSLSRLDALATGLAITGTVLIVSTVPAQHRHGPVAPPHHLLAAVAATAVLGVVAASAERFLRPGAGLGAAAGLFYAAGDIATKGALSGRGLLLIAAVAACHLAGFFVLQISFQRGSPLATAGLASLLNNSLPIAAGVVVFAERLPSGPSGPARLAGFCAVVVAAALLARQPHPQHQQAAPAMSN